MPQFDDLRRIERDGRHGWRGTLDARHHATAVLTDTHLRVRLKFGTHLRADRRFNALELGVATIAAITDADVRLAMQQTAHEYQVAEEHTLTLLSGRRVRFVAPDEDVYAPDDGLYNVMGATPWTRDLKLRAAG